MAKQTSLAGRITEYNRPLWGTNQEINQEANQQTDTKTKKPTYG